MSDNADIEFVRVHMGWLLTDWGFNEGAQEAINYINAAVGAGYGAQVAAVVALINNLPGGIGYHVAGNALKRPPITEAARALSHLDPNLAFDLAVTGQAHNPEVRGGLGARRALAIQWMKGEI